MPFSEALFRGPAPDGGLYVPVQVPRLGPDEMLGGGSFPETALRLASRFLYGDVPEAVLRAVVEEALDFPLVLRPLEDGLHVLELFHGPTLAFKDVGARFMAALMDRLDPRPHERRTVLVATSGDTGSAVARAFAGRARFRVVVLYPEDGVGAVQRRLFTTPGGNVVAAAVRGDFDDCQRLAREAFADPVADRVRLTSANSINVGRLLPQSFYYAEAVRLGGWRSGGCVFSVPSGNLGNLTGGLLAARAGLPVRRFVAAVNANDAFHRWWRDGVHETRPTLRTLSNAMDVGDPGNRERIADLFDGDLDALRRSVWSASFDDADTLEALRRLDSRTGYLADPHTAVGVLGAEAYRERSGLREPTVILATAHPAKFPEVMERAVGRRAKAPDRLVCALEGEERVERLEPRLEELRALLEEDRAGGEGAP